MLVLGTTDANGDFLSYSVDVVSLSLTKADGTVVQALPVHQRVDFAGLVDMTELVTAATILNGTYIKASIRLDNRDAVMIAPGRPALLQLDFDLATSHRVDLTTNPLTAVSVPFIVASVEPVEYKKLRVRGPLVSVNTAFEIDGVKSMGAGVGEYTNGRQSAHSGCLHSAYMEIFSEGRRRCNPRQLVCFRAHRLQIIPDT
jgi:hypothetical protein